MQYLQINAFCIDVKLLSLLLISDLYINMQENKDLSSFEKGQIVMAR